MSVEGAVRVWIYGCGSNAERLGISQTESNLLRFCQVLSGSVVVVVTRFHIIIIHLRPTPSLKPSETFPDLGSPEDLQLVGCEVLLACF